jgi:hypothetical protein
MKKSSWVILMVGCLSATLWAQSAVKPYSQDFEKSAVGSVPEEFLVLDGGFAVQEEAGKKFLELPGAPLETFGLLFGSSEKGNVGAQARFFGSGKGRRFPTFAIGINGAGGFKLQMSPAKKSLELFQGEEVKATAPFEWKSETWTNLKIELVQSKPGEWVVQGRAWLDGATEPTSPSLTLTLTAEPSAGRSSIWGSPFSGTPIRFDDLKVFEAKAK